MGPVAMRPQFKSCDNVPLLLVYRTTCRDIFRPSIGERVGCVGGGGVVKSISPGEYS